jgi:hypothetical protein
MHNHKLADQRSFCCILAGCGSARHDIQGLGRQRSLPGGESVKKRTTKIINMEV